MATYELHVGASEVAVTDAKSVFDTSWHDSRVQYIIYESELLSAGISIGDELNGLHIKIASEIMGRDISNFTIRMKHTTSTYVQTTGSGQNIFIDYSGFTTVLSGYTILRSTITANSWSPNIPFNTTFVYNGGNLVIDLTRDNTGWTAGGSNFKRLVTSSTARMRGGYADSTTTYPHDNTKAQYTETNYVIATKLTTVDETPPPTDLPTDAKMLVPTDLFPFPNSAWKRPEVKAIVSTTDNTSARLVVEHSTSPTLTGVTKTTSATVTSGTRVTLSLGTYAEDAEIYWRAYIENDTVRSDKTDIFHFTNDSSYAYWQPDNTPFMQLGDPNTHVKVIDISQYQEEASVNNGGVNWQSIKDSGINYVYLRAYGSARGTGGDNMFETFIQEANAVGIKTGAYFYTMPSVPLDLAQAREEADLFIAKLQNGYGEGKYGDLMPMMDLEDNSGVAVTGQAIVNLSVEDMLQWGNEFRNHFEVQTGRILGLYTGDFFVRNTRNNFNHDDTTGQAVAGTSGNILYDMPLWIQGYTAYSRYKGYVMPSCGGWTKWYIFQWSETGTTSGITGSVDQNLAEPMEWMMPPSDVTGVTVTDDGTSVTLSWTRNTEVDIDGYYIFLDDGMSAGAYDYVSKDISSYTFPVGGIPTNTPYTYGVIANDSFGDDSLNFVRVGYTFAGANLTPPKVTIISVSKTKISDEVGVDRANIEFVFDVDTTEYTVNVNGVDYTTGLVAHRDGRSISDLAQQTVVDASNKTVQTISIIVAGYHIVAEVDWTELTPQSNNRVNIYGRGKNGAWTEYNQA